MHIIHHNIFKTRTWTLIRVKLTEHERQMFQDVLVTVVCLIDMNRGLYFALISLYFGDYGF